jgi:hypothetical protein
MILPLGGNCFKALVAYFMFLQFIFILLSIIFLFRWGVEQPKKSIISASIAFANAFLYWGVLMVYINSKGEFASIISYVLVFPFFVLWNIVGALMLLIALIGFIASRSR